MVQSEFRKRFSDPPEQLTEPEQRLMDTDLNIDTSQARYVWLPILFDGDRPVIEWRDEWSASEYE